MFSWLFSSPHSLWLLNLGEMQRDPFYRVKCHRLNLAPSEPGSLLIWTYRDVAAEHHKGAAYQHRCYLLCLFHRGVRAPQHTHTQHTTTLDTDQGHLHWVKHDSTTSLPIKRLPSAEYTSRLGRKRLHEH